MWLIDLLQKAYQGLGIVILYRIDFSLHLYFKHYHTATCKRNSCSLSHLLQGFPESICGTGVLLSTWDKSPVLLFVELNQYQGPLRRAGTSSARRGVWCLRNPSPWKRGERQLFAAAVLGHQRAWAAQTAAKDKTVPGWGGYQELFWPPHTHSTDPRLFSCKSRAIKAERNGAKEGLVCGQQCGKTFLKQGQTIETNRMTSWWSIFGKPS